VNWKIALIIFIVIGSMRAIPQGPDKLLNDAAGWLLIGGIISIFYKWEIALLLVVTAFLLTKFRVYMNRKNIEYYKENSKEVSKDTIRE
jgi:hypothetical protein